MTHTTVRIIRDEHVALSAMLRSILLLLAEHRRQGALPDFDALRAMLFYVDEFPEQRHHRKESEILAGFNRSKRCTDAPRDRQTGRRPHLDCTVQVHATDVPPRDMQARCRKPAVDLRVSTPSRRSRFARSDVRR